MRITVRRTGGFAGITRTFEVDTATLPAARAAEIERLVRQHRKGEPAADGFGYEVTVDGEEISVSDAGPLVAAMIGPV
jgi:hypothetical protein